MIESGRADRLFEWYMTNIDPHLNAFESVCRRKALRRGILLFGKQDCVLRCSEQAWTKVYPMVGLEWDKFQRMATVISDPASGTAILEFSKPYNVATQAAASSLGPNCVSPEENGRTVSDLHS